MGRPWSEQRIRRELDALLPGHDAWPSYPQFRAAGRRELWEAIARHGGPAPWAKEYGLPYAPNRRAPTDAEVRARLRAALQGSDVPAWPSRRWLAARGGSRLVAAVDRTGGPGRWAAELGLPSREARRAWTPDAIAAALEPLLASRRTWPSRREFEQAALGGLYAAIRHGDGHPALANRYDLPLQRPRRHRRPPPRRRARSATLERRPVVRV